MSDTLNEKIIDLKIAPVLEQLRSMSANNEIHFENINNSLEAIIKGLGGRVEEWEKKHNSQQLFCGKVQAVKAEQKEAGERRQKNINIVIGIGMFILAIFTFADKKTTAQNKSDIKELKPMVIHDVDGKTYIYMKGSYQLIDSSYYTKK